MIHKERIIPEVILSERALLRRLPKNHVKRALIEADLAKKEAGFKGEINVDYFLKLLPADYYEILNDVRLVIDNHVIQMDTLILTSRILFIIEIKHYSGKVIMDTINGQFIRVKEGKEERFPNPIAQVERQRYLLKRWLGQMGFPIAPIEIAVVNSNPFTLIQSIPENASFENGILHAENLFEHMAAKVETQKATYYTPFELTCMIQKLKDQHSPLSSNILKKFGLKSAEVLTGVQCKVCQKLRMSRVYGIWTCSSCGSYSKNAHLEAIDDYLHIISKSITNKACRDFLHLSSRYTAKRLLKNANLVQMGTRKTSYYKYK